MNRLKQKLNNTRGASIIIAMVFMLICLFVGGSVLVAATMNTQRIKHAPQHQVFMDRRSAASLIADDLRVDPDAPITLVFTKTTKSTQTGTKKNGHYIFNGSSVDLPETYSCEIKGIAGEPTGMKRLLVESAVRDYQLNHADEKDITVKYRDGAEVKNLTCTNVEKLSSEQKAQASVIVAPSIDGLETNSFSAHCILRAENHEPEPIEKNFIVNFKDENGDPYSMLEVRMYGAESVPSTHTVEEIVQFNSNDTYQRIETTTETIIYFWMNPIIEKGA